MDFSAALAQAISEPKTIPMPPSQVQIPSDRQHPVANSPAWPYSNGNEHEQNWVSDAVGDITYPLPEGSRPEEIIIYWKTHTIYWKSHAEQYKEENTALKAHCQLLDKALSDTKNMISNLIMLSPDSIEPEGVLKNGAKLRAALDTDDLETVQELLKKTNIIAQKVLLDNFDLRESLNSLYEDNQKLREINQCLEQGTNKVMKEIVDTNVRDEQVHSTHKRKRSMSVGNIDLFQLGNVSSEAPPPKETTQDVIETLGLFEKTEPAVDNTKGLTAESSVPNGDLIAAYNQIDTLEKTIKSMVETKFEMIEIFSNELERLRYYIK